MPAGGGGGNTAFETRVGEIESMFNSAAVEWGDYSQADPGVRVEKRAGDIVYYNGNYYYVKDNYSNTMSKYWSENPDNIGSFIRITHNFIGDDAVIERADWGNAKVYPYLNAGDIVITSGNEAWLILNSGDYYSYPIGNNGNIVKMQ